MQQLKKISINFEHYTLSVKYNEKSSCETGVFFLHGFSGSAKDFFFLIDKNLEANLIFIDMIGHGESDSPSSISFYSQNELIRQIDKIIDYFSFPEVILFGYSMGGRAALSYAIKNQHKLKALILESSSPGIIDQNEAQKRRQEDKELAEFILSNNIDSFVEKWMSLPLFDSLKLLPFDKYLKHKGEKYRNNKRGIANMLRGFGQGTMTPLWNEIETLAIPVLLIIGEKDLKYKEINYEMQNRIKNCALEIISNSKHIPHLENEERFVEVVKLFLRVQKSGVNK